MTGSTPRGEYRGTLLSPQLGHKPQPETCPRSQPGGEESNGVRKGGTGLPAPTQEPSRLEEGHTHTGKEPGCLRSIPAPFPTS